MVSEGVTRREDVGQPDAADSRMNIVDRLCARLAVKPVVGGFFVDETAQEEAHVSREAAATSERLLAATVVVTIAAAAIQSVVWWISVAAFGDKTFFDIDQDSGIFTWASATATAFTALPLLVFGYLYAKHAYRWLVVLLGAASLYFSADDQVAIHERIGQAAKSGILHTSAEWVNGLIWPIAYFPLLGFVFLAFMWLAGRVCTRRERNLVIIALASLVLAIFLEMIHGPIGALRDRANFRYYAEVTAEEGLELAAWIVLAGVTMSLLARNFIDVRRRISVD